MVIRERDFWARYHQAELAGSAEDVWVALPWDDDVDLLLVSDENQKSLFLFERASGVKHPLGWWDDARWHPFALRWDELETLTRDWGARADLHPRPPAPLLLLSCFVGFGVGDEDQRARAREAVARAFEAVGYTR